MTPTRLRELWSELLSEQPEAVGDLRLRLMDSVADVRLFAAVTARDGLPGLLVELPDHIRPRAFRTLVTRAFHMSAPAITGLPPGRWALVVGLKDRAFSDLFEVLVTDVLGAIQGASGAVGVLEAVIRCINRWRQFVERKGEPLTDEEVRGLVGELVVLCRCIRRFGADAALATWKGPEGGLKDFELPDASVEVKTFQGEDAATVLISPPDQLDGVAPRPMYLCAVRLTLSESQGATLGEFVNRAMAVIGSGSATLALLEDRLAAAGYLMPHAPLYPKRFVAGPVLMYAISPQFPRIRSADVPHGVMNVRFALSLTAIAPFKVDPLALIGARVPQTEVIE